MARYRILFVCTHNAARSQMAEGLMRARYGDRYAVYSAGTAPTEVHPLAVRVMHEVGVDLRAHRSEPLGRFQEEVFDYVVTVCDQVHALSPHLRAREMVIHRGFDDPSRADAEAQLEAFRQVRDAIDVWLDRTFGRLPVPAA